MVFRYDSASTIELSLENVCRWTEANSQRSVIHVAHRLEGIEEFCTHAAVVSEGMLVEHGSISDLLYNPESQLYSFARAFGNLRPTVDDGPS